MTDTDNNRVLLLRPPFHSNQMAVIVLGQPNFKTADTGTADNLFAQPVSAIMDQHGAVWVTDQTNNRVLRFSPPLKNGKSADLVLGQPNFTTSDKGDPPSATNLWIPTYITFDSGGNLWVADRDNCRVLEYIPPFSSNMPASLVLGQPNLNTRNCTFYNPTDTPIPTANLTNQTEGIAFDPSGDLWVADRGDNRVVEFIPPFINGMAVSVVIGQNSPTSGNPHVTQSGLNYPNGIAFVNGNLWVADTKNNRTLEFDAPFSTGMDASVVLGQPDFNTADCNTTRNGECWAFGLAADPKGNLWLAEHNNCRALQYKPDRHGLFATDQNANIVIGQRNFTTLACAPTRTNDAFPQGISIGNSP